MITTSKASKIIPHIVLVIMTILALMPIVLLFMASITDEQELIKNGYSFFPKKLSLYSFRYIFRSASTIFRAYGVTIFVTAVGTLTNMVLTVMLAYPISRPELKCRNVIAFLVFFTMLFNGGLVPNYMLILNLGLMNTIWAVILPMTLSAYNVIVARTFFISSIPNELHESAELDGCGEFRFLISIVLPLSKAIMAVLVLWIAIGIWNSYFNPMIYLNDKKKYPLQLILREILLMANVDFTKAAANPELYYKNQQLSEILRYGTIIISALPLMILYPFIQKYFVQGVMIGSVKG